MPKIMLIDAAQPEETRVAVMDGKRLENFDIESAAKKQLKGNIYLAKVTRVEPSLQAAFVSYGGNRHGFLPFAEIHPDYYRIPVEDRERLLAEQEELQRQMMQEAREREERELAEAEARANAPEDEAEENGEDMSDEDMAEEDTDEDDGASAETDQENDDDSDENLDADDSVDQDDASDDDDDSEDEEAALEGNDVGDASDTQDGETLDGEATGEEASEERKGGRGRGRNRYRGRNQRGGRGRGDKKSQGLDRARPDRIAERDGDEDEGSMTPLWKRMHRSYKIQEVIKRGQIMLIQVVKEERGNKGAAVTSYITMPGRYCVLMPNSPQSGGVSRKVASHAERRKMREMLDELQVPDGMSVILRTAGVDREIEEVKRDLDYMMRLWDRVRDTTMTSTAPALIHEEGSLVKRAIRDLYSKDFSEIVIHGEEAAASAREMMDMMMPESVSRIRTYDDSVPLFIKYGAEAQIDAIHSNTVTLSSGGYLVINPTEALVSIDINSGKATRERHIEETALKTNLEAADEIARQLRLRDLGGLVVIDFIDMESRRNNGLVERRMRDALSGDRARVQVGRISMFGLLELSRQRLRPSLTETHFQTCPHCRGLGIMRTTEALALAVLRAIETAGMEGRAGEIQVSVTQDVAMFLFNAKRASLGMLEQRYGLKVALRVVPLIESDQGFEMDVTQSRRAERVASVDATVDADLEEEDGENVSETTPANRAPRDEAEGEDGKRRRGRRGGRNRGRGRGRDNADENANADVLPGNTIVEEASTDTDDDIGNRKTDEQGREFDGNAMGTEQQIRAERGGRGRGGRTRGGRENKPRGERKPRGQNNDQVVDDNIGNRAPAAVVETRVAYGHTKRDDTQPQENAPRDYEKVNEVSGDKKKGWWKKLTG